MNSSRSTSCSNRSNDSGGNNSSGYIVNRSGRWSGRCSNERRVRRTAADRANKLTPGENESAYMCPVCSERTVMHQALAMVRHLLEVHGPVDYQGMDLTAFGRLRKSILDADGFDSSGPGCSQLRLEHLDAVFNAGDGVSAIQHACEQVVSNGYWQRSTRGSWERGWLLSLSRVCAPGCFR
ncbi:hypothetical protein CYMTET_3319 [Cymbomonas tetramitiformis]|uniref:Uncharacterized protein n=1 Tax=Cymbomonas tetramitiformis TaxID=36881 RepID=A0AAE0H3I3_9CHLO|nr:hypothetical protein CYMTET_3319 [Cymbomonas tetramitiformis]